MVTQMRTYNAFPVIASQSRTQMEKNPELAAAADLTSAQFELMLAERDLANLRWTRSRKSWLPPAPASSSPRTIA